MKQFLMTIPACTRLIEIGTLDQNSRAIAYSNRGADHRQKGDYDAAIADTSKAIEIDPKYADA